MIFTSYKFSHEISKSSIHFLKSELSRIRAAAPSDCSCHAVIETIPPNKYSTWIQFSSRAGVFRTSRNSENEISSIKMALGELEERVAHWQDERKEKQKG